MNTVKAFLKKYWITCCIFIGLVALYIFLTSNGLVNPYLFPSTDKIKAAFIDSKDMMFGNAVASFKLLIPSICFLCSLHFFRDDYGVEPESSGNFTSGYLCVQRSAFYSLSPFVSITCTNIIFCFRIFDSI